jgi:hypothetical protein
VGWFVRIAVLVLGAVKAVFQFTQIDTVVGEPTVTSGPVDPKQEIEDKEKDVYAKLGKLIWDGIPYQYAASLKRLEELETALDTEPQVKGEFIADSPTIVLDGPAKEFGGSDDVAGVTKEVKHLKEGTRGEAEEAAKEKKAGHHYEVTEALIAAQPWDSLWWLFKGKQYRVTKAIMVPYKVNNKTGSGTTTRHFLIGYMGVDSNG